MAERVRERFGAPAAGLSDWLLRLEQLRYAPQPAAALAALRSEFRTLPWPDAGAQGTAR